LTNDRALRNGKSNNNKNKKIRKRRGRRRTTSIELGDPFPGPKTICRNRQTDKPRRMHNAVAEVMML